MNMPNEPLLIENNPKPRKGYFVAVLDQRVATGTENDCKKLLLMATL